MRIVQSIEEIAARRNVRHRVEVINQDPPATCSQEVRHCCLAKTNDSLSLLLLESCAK